MESSVDSPVGAMEEYLKRQVSPLEPVGFQDSVSASAALPTVGFAMRAGDDYVRATLRQVGLPEDELVLCVVGLARFLATMALPGVGSTATRASPGRLAAAYRECARKSDVLVAPFLLSFLWLWRLNPHGRRAPSDVSPAASQSTGSQRRAGSLSEITEPSRGALDAAVCGGVEGGIVSVPMPVSAQVGEHMGDMGDLSSGGGRLGHGEGHSRRASAAPGEDNSSGVQGKAPDETCQANGVRQGEISSCGAILGAGEVSSRGALAAHGEASSRGVIPGAEPSSAHYNLLHDTSSGGDTGRDTICPPRRLSINLRPSRFAHAPLASESPHADSPQSPAGASTGLPTGSCSSRSVGTPEPAQTELEEFLSLFVTAFAALFDFCRRAPALLLDATALKALFLAFFARALFESARAPRGARAFAGVSAAAAQQWVCVLAACPARVLQALGRAAGAALRRQQGAGSEAEAWTRALAAAAADVPAWCALAQQDFKQAELRYLLDKMLNPIPFQGQRRLLRLSEARAFLPAAPLLPRADAARTLFGRAHPLCTLALLTRHLAVDKLIPLHAQKMVAASQLCLLKISEDGAPSPAKQPLIRRLTKLARGVKTLEEAYEDQLVGMGEPAEESPSTADLRAPRRKGTARPQSSVDGAVRAVRHFQNGLTPDVEPPKSSVFVSVFGARPHEPPNTVGVGRGADPAVRPGMQPMGGLEEIPDFDD